MKPDGTTAWERRTIVEVLNAGTEYDKDGNLINVNGDLQDAW